MPVPKDCNWSKAKHKRCIKKVKANSPGVNAYAICNSICTKSS